MTKRLSDERLREYTSGTLVGETSSMAAEIIELRSRVAELDAATSNAIGEALTLRTLCDEVYQVVGALAHEAGVFAAPEVARVLNNLVAASNGNDLPHETLLPFEVKAAGPVMPETPSDEQWERIVDALDGEIGLRHYQPIYDAIRAALLMENALLKEQNAE